MSAFETYEIAHLSASSINAYLTNQSLWVLERVLGKWSPPGPMAFRGSAVEDGVTYGLKNLDAPIADCAALALSKFDEKAGLKIDDKAVSERAKIPGYVESALAELRPYGTPTHFQDRVELYIDGLELPIIGLTDYRYDQHGLIVDLKTTARLPSKVPDPHIRQGAIYARAMGNYGMRFCYSKAAPGRDGISSRVYELDEPMIANAITEIREIAIRMERFLSLSDDPMELAALVVPDYGHFYWNEKNRIEARSVFGF
jgi:hypothetical protein